MQIKGLRGQGSGRAGSSGGHSDSGELLSKIIRHAVKAYQYLFAVFCVK